MAEIINLENYKKNKEKIDLKKSGQENAQWEKFLSENGYPSGISREEYNRLAKLRWENENKDNLAAN